MGPLLALAFALLGGFAPSALPAALLLGTSVDLLLPWHGLNIYSNEWALLGAVLGLGLGQARGAVRPGRAGWVLAAAVPLLLIQALHALGPGPLGAALKDTLRAAQFVLGVFLPAWLLQGDSRAFERTRVVACAFILAAVALGLAQWLQGPGGSLNVGHEVEVFYGLHQAAASFFQHHNQFGAFLAVALPFSVAAGAPLLAAAAAVALYASYSRGAMVSLLGGAVVFAWALPRRLVLLVGLGLAVGLAVGMTVSEPLRIRVSSIVDRSQNQDRALLRRLGHEMGEESPWWGQGPGYVTVELPKRLAPIALPDEARMMFSSHLHDQWLQWRVELGRSGVLAWAFFFANVLAWALWAPQSRRRYGIALGIAVLAFLAQSFTDRLGLHARGLEIALLWGLCLAGAQPEKG